MCYFLSCYLFFIKLNWAHYSETIPKYPVILEIKVISKKNWIFLVNFPIINTESCTETYLKADII